MASSSELSEESVLVALRQGSELTKNHSPSNLKHNPPWRRVLLRHLPPGRSMKSVYRLLGWTRSRRYWLARSATDLHLSLASQMAMAVGAKLGPFLADLATEQGIPPLAQDSLSLRALKAKKARKRKDSQNRKCSHCGKFRHLSKDCPTLRSQSDVQLMLARGEASAESGVRLRRPR